MDKPFAVVIALKVVARFDDWQSAERYADQTNECHPNDADGEIAGVINLEFDADDITAW